MHSQLWVLCEYRLISVTWDEIEVAFITVWVEFLAHLRGPEICRRLRGSTESLLKLAWMIEIKQLDWILLAVQANFGLNSRVNE